MVGGIYEPKRVSAAGPCAVQAKHLSLLSLARGCISEKRKKDVGWIRVIS